jgi:predicted negative regulator of RcsB-dependent stress response
MSATGDENRMNSAEVKTYFEIASYCVGIVGLVAAVWTYRQNRSLERSRWASSLYEKFYESVEHKGVRRDLDDSPDSQAVINLVDREPSEFTDYLNFFEHVAYLVKCGQIKRADADAYFNYYFSCLRRHKSVVKYIQDGSKGFETLKKFLRL